MERIPSSVVARKIAARLRFGARLARPCFTLNCLTRRSRRACRATGWSCRPDILATMEPDASCYRLTAEQAPEANDGPAVFKILRVHRRFVPAHCFQRYKMPSSRSRPGLSDSAVILASLMAFATTRTALPPDNEMSFATASTAEFVRPATIILKPSDANRLHNWAPSPRSGPTPITIAVFVPRLACRSNYAGDP